jgi:drug/metabolite transporter (DMT)-like permease
MAILFGLLAALLWGVGDFLIRGVSDRVGTVRGLLHSHIVAFVAIGCAALLWRDGPDNPGHAAWLAASGGAVIYVVAIYALYQALQIGPLAIVAPIVGSYAAVAAIIALATGHSSIDLAGGIALSIIMAGIMFVTIEPGDDASRSAGRLRGIAWAAVSALLSGTLAYVQAVSILPAVGSFRALLTNLAAVIIVTGVVSVARRESIAARNFDTATVALGLCIGAGFLAYFFGLSTGDVVVVSILSGTCGAVTAGLGVLILRERVLRHQWAGIAMIVGGVAMLNGVQG